MIVTVSNRAKWLANQVGMLVLMVGLASLVFNLAYRYLVDRHISSPLFYVLTTLAGLVVVVALRRDYLFVKRFEFTSEAIMVRTALGFTKQFDLTQFAFVPSLHKSVNVPESKASLSFDVKDRAKDRSVRNYSWTGFSTEDFRAVSRMYGFAGETDFEQKDFGKAR